MKSNEKFQDRRKRTWEKFHDPCYYDMTCVRCLDSGKQSKSFNSQLSFHFATSKQANQFQELIQGAF